MDAVAVQIIAVGVEPGLSALDMAADPRDDLPELRRMVHFDEMGDLVGREIVQHIGRRENQPPGKRQRPGRGAGAPAARLVANGNPPDFYAQRLGVESGSLLQILARFALQIVVHPPLGMFDATCRAEDTLTALARFGPHGAALARSMRD